MKNFLTFILLLFTLLTTAQNTVSIQGNFSTSDPDDVYLNCDQTIRTIEVEVVDGSNIPVSGENVTASLVTGSGTLNGTLTQTTNASGIATFDDLDITVNNDITIQFDDTGTGTDTTKTIQSIECDVNEIWTNYGGFWNSSSSNINPLEPDNSHDLLAFEFNNINYSTGVNDTKLTNNGVTYTSANFRALPVATLPTSGSSSYFIGLGQLADGIDNAVNNGSNQPFQATLNGTEIASYLTDGEQGLDLGTNATNIPSGTTARFNLSSAGIITSNIGDGIPDILISQTAQPSSNIDELEFVDSGGSTVGNVVSLDITNEPVVGNWVVDFYKFDSTQGQNNFINTPRPIHFFAVDISDFGITSANAGDAVALLYRPNGNSDPAFLAFNEPSLGVATQLSVILEPSIQNCDGTLPSNIQIQLEDQNGNSVSQAGLNITASLESGPGSLAGTTNQTTDGAGVATFNDLEFTIGGNHIIRFSFAGLDDALTSVIGDASGCDTLEWSGNINNNWDETGNWVTGVIPDGNNAVIIPNGRPRYPILNVDAGAGDLTMGDATSIELNGFLLALNGSLTGVASGANLDASEASSELYMSDASAQNIPSGFVDPSVANFTVENAGGVTLNSTMNITEVLDVKQGTLTTNDHITMICSFSPRQTAQIDAIEGTISGDITVEQCFPARRAFRLVSSSTTTSNSIHDNWQESATAYNDSSVPNNFGTHITGLNAVAGSGHSSTPGAGDQTNGLDWQPSGNPSIYSFNNSTQSWVAVLETENASSPSTPILEIGDAYRLMIRGARQDATFGLFDITDNTTDPTDTRLRSTGTVQNGSFSQSVSSTSQNWSLVGNPYHAMVSVKQLIDNSTNIDRFYTIWDPTLGGTPTEGVPGGRGAFVTYNVDEIDFAIGGGASGSTDINNFLQPYQAAFFRTSSNGSASVDFAESVIEVNATQTNTFSNSGISAFPHIYTKLFAAADYGIASPLAFNQIRFNAKSDNALNQFDAQAFYNVDETLARLADNQIWAIENRNLPVADETLPLLIYQYRRTNYTLEFEVGPFDGVDVYLEDTYLNETHLLDENQINTVNFSIDESIPASVAFDRFNFLFEEDTFSVNDNEIADQIKIYPNPAGDLFNINFGALNLNQAQIILTDLQGREVIKLSGKEISNKEIQVNVANLAQGIYIVKIQSQRFQFTDKLIVE